MMTLSNCLSTYLIKKSSGYIFSGFVLSRWYIHNMCVNISIYIYIDISRSVIFTCVSYFHFHNNASVFAGLFSGQCTYSSYTVCSIIYTIAFQYAFVVVWTCWKPKKKKNIRTSCCKILFKHINYQIWKDGTDTVIRPLGDMEMNYIAFMKSPLLSHYRLVISS